MPMELIPREGKSLPAKDVDSGPPQKGPQHGLKGVSFEEGEAALAPPRKDEEGEAALTPRKGEKGEAALTPRKGEVSSSRQPAPVATVARAKSRVRKPRAKLPKSRITRKATVARPITAAEGSADTSHADAYDQMEQQIRLCYGKVINEIQQDIDALDIYAASIPTDIDAKVSEAQAKVLVHTQAVRDMTPLSYTQPGLQEALDRHRGFLADASAELDQLLKQRQVFTTFRVERAEMLAEIQKLVEMRDELLEKLAKQKAQGEAVIAADYKVDESAIMARMAKAAEAYQAILTATSTL